MMRQVAELKKEKAAVRTGGYMKKIIGVLAMSSLIAGSSFADVAITLNARTRASVFTQTKKVDTDATNGTSNTWFNLTDSQPTDCFVTEIKTDYAGVHLDIDPANDTDTNLAIDAYYGWMNFGALQLTTGKLDTRFTPRYNTTAVQGGLTDSDTAKFGLSNSMSIKGTAIGKTFMYDANNITTVAGTKVLSLMGAYTLKNVLPGDLVVQAALIKNSFKSDTNTTDDTSSVQSAGYVLEAAYTQPKQFVVDVMTKVPTEKSIVAGVYATALMIPNSTAALGFTYGSQGDDSVTLTGAGVETMWKAYAIDARFVTKPTDALQCVLQAKYSSLTPDQKIDTKAKDSAQTAFETVGQVSYIINDTIKAACDAGLYMWDIDNYDDSKLANNWFKVRPAIELSAGKGATLTAGVQYEVALDTKKADSGTVTASKLSIPLIMRVKM
jgi:hypothetical protein